MNLIFREVNPKNYQEVYNFNLCHEFSHRDSTQNYIPDSEEMRRDKTDNILKKLLSNEQKYHCLAVFDENEMIAAHFLNRTDIDDQPACHIHGLWVHAHYRKRGIAKKLKLMGETWAKKMGCQLMDANVRVTNDSMISLNKALGYEISRYNFRKKL